MREHIAGMACRFDEIALGLALVICLALVATPADARKKTAPPPSPPEEQEPVAEPQPYRPQVMRLAEILGALSYLDELCADARGTGWRDKMQALLESEPRTRLEKEQMAGAFNRGYHGYRLSYRACTTNARAAIRRFLAEGAQIAHEVVDRYGSS
jgi:uncharacterized protein (TIGR02301 family)